MFLQINEIKNYMFRKYGDRILINIQSRLILYGNKNASQVLFYFKSIITLVDYLDKFENI